VGIPRIAAAAAGAATAVDCSVDNDVVLPSEYRGLRNAVQGYNAYISAQAQQRGWAYVDINQFEAAYKADPTKIAAFPSLPTGPGQPNVLFGSYFTLDGVHPSAAFHRIFTDSIISAVNRTYGTTIPFVGP
jgi:phospholipase/lecithinase/hemolysin